MSFVNLIGRKTAQFQGPLLSGMTTRRNTSTTSDSDLRGASMELMISVQILHFYNMILWKTGAMLISNSLTLIITNDMAYHP